MGRFVAFLSLCISLVWGLPGAEALKLSVVEPTESHRLMGEGRDFYVVASLDREGEKGSEKPFNVRFELFREGAEEPVRTVTSAVDLRTGVTPPEAILTDYEHGWTPGAGEDILVSPPPDLVYDPRRLDSFFNPEIKGVVMDSYAAALVQGGATGTFDTNYGSVYGEDILKGSYTLKITALDQKGAELASDSVPMTFGAVPRKVIARFSPAAHFENVKKFCADRDLHIYLDLFPGYWNASTLPSGSGEPSTLFYEIVRRWRPNDLTEYREGVIEGVLYNINEKSATQGVEIAGLARLGRLGSGDITWYYYDAGEVSLAYEGAGGKKEIKKGAIVPFPPARNLVFTRAEIRDSGKEGYAVQDNIFSPEDSAKKVDWDLSDGVHLKPGELLSLYGVVKPIQPALEDTEALEDGTYWANNRIAEVRYTLTDGKKEVLTLEGKGVELTRTDISSGPSIYEFRHNIPLGTDFAGEWTVKAEAFDSHGKAVEGTAMTFKLYAGEAEAMDPGHVIFGGIALLMIAVYVVFRITAKGRSSR